MFYDDLCKNLNPRSGIDQPNTAHDEKESSILFDIVWKGDFHFIVSGWTHFGWYYIVRNKQEISEIHHFAEINSNLFKGMQKMIDEVEGGKYKNKKTLNEKIIAEVEKRNLVSYMNNTKWHKLIEAIKSQMCDIPIQYKTLFEVEVPNTYWTIYGDEHFDYMNMAIIEWFKIACTIKESKFVGRLFDPVTTIIDKEEELLQIFGKYNIPYEYDGDERGFIIYGYK